MPTEIETISVLLERCAQAAALGLALQHGHRMPVTCELPSACEAGRASAENDGRAGEGHGAWNFTAAASVAKLAASSTSGTQSASRSEVASPASLPSSPVRACSAICR